MTTQITDTVQKHGQPEEEANRYSRRSIMRSEHMYGEGFQSPGGLEAVEAYCQKLHMWEGMHILEIGSGLGGASFYFTRTYGASVTGLDVSREMVDISTERMKRYKLANISFRQGDIRTAQLEQDTFDLAWTRDCILYIGKILDAQATEDFPNIQTMLTALCRVLRVGGVIILNMCSRQQLLDGYWWAELIPKAVDQMSTRIPSIERTVQMLEDVGFQSGGVIVPLHEVLQGPSYFDPKAPLSKSFREGDSTWSLISEQELHQALEQIRTLNEGGSMKEYFDRREQRRQRVGQTTFIFARKY